MKGDRTHVKLTPGFRRIARILIPGLAAILTVGWFATARQGAVATAAKPAPSTTAIVSNGDGSGLVHTDEGPVQGTVTRANQIYLGIPYAAPPLGNKRWSPPQPHVNWGPAPIDATRAGHSCPQPDIPFSDSNTSNEDCLVLNVYTPASVSRPLPVMVFIHGGGFVTGSSTDYDYSQFAAHDNEIVVSMNYRLGVLGLIALSAVAAPNGPSGNYGLQDQRAALQWVRRNIGNFGGDKGNVTIFGQAAGAASVCYLLASPQARGLFTHAIMQSGPCTQKLPNRHQAEAQGDQLAAAVGCTGTPAVVKACLDDKPVADLINTGKHYQFTADVDGDFLPDQVATLIRSGHFNRVPVIVGYNHDEGNLFVAQAYDLTGKTLAPADYPSAVADRFGMAPPWWRPPGGPSASHIVDHYPLTAYFTPEQALGAAETDQFACMISQTQDALAHRVPTYGYEFDDQSSYFPIHTPGLAMGAYHESELIALAGNVIIPGAGPDPRYKPTATQTWLSHQMQTDWGQFGASGIPNNPAGARWPRYDRTRQVVSFHSASVDILANQSLEQGHQCGFWDSSS